MWTIIHIMEPGRKASSTQLKKICWKSSNVWVFGVFVKFPAISLPRKMFIRVPCSLAHVTEMIKQSSIFDLTSHPLLSAPGTAKWSSTSIKRYWALFLDCLSQQVLFPSNILPQVLWVHAYLQTPHTRPLLYYLAWEYCGTYLQI